MLAAPCNVLSLTIVCIFVQNLRKMIRNIMTEAERIKAHSIAIPPIGGGYIGYFGFSESIVTTVLMEEVADYIGTHSESCIRDVRFVVLHSDKKLLQVADYVLQNAITFVIINSILPRIKRPFTLTYVEIVTFT